MESNDLSEGEELSREMCFKHLCITFKYYLTNDPEKNQKFRSLIEHIVNKGVIQAVMIDKVKVVFFYNKNLITKSDFYSLIANIYVHFFGTSMAMKMFINIGCALFDHDEKEHRSIYVTMRRYRYKELPASYTKYF